MRAVKARHIRVLAVFSIYWKCFTEPQLLGSLWLERFGICGLEVLEMAALRLPLRPLLAAR